MAAKLRLFSICEVDARITRSKPPQLAVAVHGYAVSSGWTDPELLPLEKRLSPDGILDLAFVGTPPASINQPALTPQSAGLVWTDDVDRLVGVRVVSRTNEVVRLVVEEPASLATTEPVGEETTQIAGEGLHPHFAAAAAAGGATTMAVGEEGSPPVTTMVVGEETAMTWPSADDPSKPIRRWEAVLMDPFGPIGTERAAAAGMTTMMVGEEGHPPVSTMAVGEETVFKTAPLGEEGGGNDTGPFMEKPPQGEVLTLPEIEDPRPTTTAPRIEEVAAPITTAAGEHVVSRQAAVPVTTLIVGEEGAGPLPTTRIDAEEYFQRSNPAGLTTLVVGEESVGEGWYDPQDFNPLGRR